MPVMQTVSDSFLGWTSDRGLAGRSGKVFDHALEAFGLHYADQAESDYRLFMQAIKEGRLEASMIF